MSPIKKKIILKRLTTNTGKDKISRKLIGIKRIIATKKRRHYFF